MRLGVILAHYQVRVHQDDVVGGAELTGTFMRSDLLGDLQELAVEPVLHQQGLEVRRVFDCWCVPLDLDIRPHDQIEVVGPPDHQFYARRFAVLAAGLPAGLNQYGTAYYEMRLMLRDYSRED